MKLILKFNIVFIAIFLIGLGAAGYVSNQLLQNNAREEILQNARLVMEASLATRAYTSSQIRPLLETQMKYAFLPQSVPSYSATEVLGGLRKKFPEYSYKEAALNPTNPRDRAVEWETDIINQFRSNPERGEIIGERDTPTGRTLYIARPFQIKDPGCLPCHSTVEAAPKTMVDRYGPANGFGWQLNEVIGAQVVSVPDRRADPARPGGVPDLHGVAHRGVPLHRHRAESHAAHHGDPAGDEALEARRPGEHGPDGRPGLPRRGAGTRSARSPSRSTG